MQLNRFKRDFSIVSSSASVVIPAHDEERVIARCLRALTEGYGADRLDIVVVCNGCRDRTAAIARSFGPPVRVLETHIACKGRALNLGDRAARFFPRFYVDADVVLPAKSVRRVAEVLRNGRVKVAAPSISINVEGRSWPIRSYYEIWQRLPYCREQMVGSGVYALSEAGRRRFGDFPEAFGDDEFVRRSFAESERRQLAHCRFQIDAPTSFRSLFRLRLRWVFTNVQIAKLYPQLQRTKRRNYRPALLEIARNPRLQPAFALYCAIAIASAAIGRCQYHLSPRANKWARDDTARNDAGNSI